MEQENDIDRKCKKYPQFKKQMDEIETFYRLELNLAIYEEMKKLQQRRIFESIEEGDRLTILFYGFKFEPEEDVQKLYRLYIRTYEQLLTKQTQRYTVVFFNTLCPSNDAFSAFKSIYRTLPKMFYSKLERIYVVHPTWTVNMLDWIVIGRLAKMFSRRLQYVKSIGQLLKLKVPKNVASVLPREISEFSQQKEIGKNKDKELPTTSPPKKRKSPFVFLDIAVEKYEMSEQRVPKLLKILLLAFNRNPQMLEHQGIFRKSGNIEDEEELVTQLSNKNQQFLDTVNDGFVVTGVVKKFFTHLLEPVLPYESYETVMKASGITAEKEVAFAQDILGKIPELNYRIILCMISFMKNQVIKRQAVTKMTEYNCAVVFAPCFSRPRNPDFADLLGTGKMVKFLTILFIRFQQVFGSKPEQWDLCRRSLKAEECLGEENRASSESPKRSSNEDASKKALNQKQLNT